MFHNKNKLIITWELLHLQLQTQSLAFSQKSFVPQYYQAPLR